MQEPFQLSVKNQREYFQVVRKVLEERNFECADGCAALLSPLLLSDQVAVEMLPGPCEDSEPSSKQDNGRDSGTSPLDAHRKQKPSQHSTTTVGENHNRKLRVTKKSHRAGKMKFQNTKFAPKGLLLGVSHFLAGRYETAGSKRTVAVLAQYCIDRLKETKGAKDVLEPLKESFKHVVPMVLSNNPKLDVQLIEQRFATCVIDDLRTYLCESLEKLRGVAVHTMETFRDFGYLWKAAAATLQTGGAHSEQSSSNFSVTALHNLKDSAWSLACIDHIVGSDGREEDRGPLADIGDRKKRILSNAAGICLLVALPRSPDNVSTSFVKIFENRSNGAAEKQRPPAASEMSAIGQLKRSLDPLESSEKETKRARMTTNEDEAIAALSMMLSGNSPQPTEPERKEDTRDFLSQMVDCANDLYSFLHVSSTGEKLDRTFDKAQLEDAIVSLTSRVIPFLMQEGGKQVSSKKRQENSDQQGFADRLVKAVEDSHGMSLLSDPQKLSRKLVDLRRALPDYGHWTKSNSGHVVHFLEESILCQQSDVVLAYICECKNEWDDSISPPSAFVIDYDPDDHRTPQTTEQTAAELIAGLRDNVINGDLLMTDIMELNEWCVSIASVTTVKPSTRVRLYLEASDAEVAKERVNTSNGVIGGWRNVILPALNRAIFKLTWEDSHPSKACLQVSREAGELLIGEPSDDDKRLCASVMVLFYHSLESILFHETARLKSASHPRLVQSEAFHRALLACCYLCVIKGFGQCPKLTLGARHRQLDIYGVLRVMETTPYTFLKVSECFSRALQLDKFRGKLSTPIRPGLPRIMVIYLQQCEAQILDSLIWSQDETYSMEGCLVDTILEMQLLQRDTGEQAWPPDVLIPSLPEEADDYVNPKTGVGRQRRPPRTPQANPDYSFVDYVIRKLQRVVYFRIVALCRALGIPPEYPIASQTWVAFRHMLRHYVDLMSDRHVDQLVLCSLYAVSKVMHHDPEVTFVRIIDAYIRVRGSELGERTCRRIVRHIPICVEEDIYERPEAQSKRFGNVIELYNKVFVTTMKNHLLQSKSIKKAALKMRRFIAEEKARVAAMNAAEATGRSDRVPEIQVPEIPYFSLGNQSTLSITEGNVLLNVRIPQAPAWKKKQTKKVRGRGRKLPLSKSRSKFEAMTRTIYKFGDANRDVSTQACISFSPLMIH